MKTGECLGLLPMHCNNSPLTDSDTTRFQQDLRNNKIDMKAKDQNVIVEYS